MDGITKPLARFQDGPWLSLRKPTLLGQTVDYQLYGWAGPSLLNVLPIRPEMQPERSNQKQSKLAGCTVMHMVYRVFSKTVCTGV